MGALTDRYKAILKKQAWHKRLMEWHKDSHPLTKNEDGTPKVFYHGTGADFDTFDRGDIGFHFGTQKSANDRLRHTNKIDYGNIMPVYLKAKNLIRLKDMRFWYDTAKIAKELYKESILNKDEKNQFTTNIYDKNAKMSNLREILLSKGYDGIIYKNAVENKGEDSFIVLSPNQIKSIHNKGTFDENSAVITDSVTLDSPVKSKLQKEKRGIWNVTFNGKNSTAIYKDIDFIDDAIKFEQGKADYIDNKGNFKNGFGVLHIVKHIGKNQDGWVSEKEIVNIGVAIRNTKPYIKSGKRIYEYYNNFGDRFKIIIGDKKNGERTISFYSNRKAGFGNDSQNYIYNQPFGRRGGSHNAQPATSSTDTIIPKNTNQVNMDGAETMNILQQIKTETSVLAKTKLVKEWRSLGVADKAKIIKEYRNEIKEDY
ncbi:MAG: hypothetical protein LT067_01605, partial [Sulfurovum sp.]|nr:hypothetical protein [Sulfurovum sp.]